MKTVLNVLAMLLALSASPAMAATALCDVIQKLETTTPEKSDDPRERRWVEFHWAFDPGDPFSFWACRHSSQKIAVQTCAWLNDYANRSFPMELPQGIMACYGYQFPDNAYFDWDDIAGTITLQGQNGNRLLLNMNYRDVGHREVAMRLAVEAEDAHYAPDELPPITAIPLITPN